jgi:hypothetical protein
MGDKMIKTITSLFLIFVFGVQYIICPNLVLAQGIGQYEESQELVITNEDNNIDIPVYYQQLDAIINDGIVIKGYKSLFYLKAVSAYLDDKEYIPFIIGQVINIEKIKNGESVRVKTKDAQGKLVAYDLLYHYGINDLDIKPEVGGTYLFGYISYKFENNEYASFLTKIWDFNNIGNAILDENKNIIGISKEKLPNQELNLKDLNKAFISPYFKVNYLLNTATIKECNPYPNIKLDESTDIFKLFNKITGLDDINVFLNWVLENKTVNLAPIGWIPCYLNYLNNNNKAYLENMIYQFAYDSNNLAINNEENNDNETSNLDNSSNSNLNNESNLSPVNEQTQPSEPTKPTEPSQPSNLSQPSQPNQPLQPSNPSNSNQSNQSSFLNSISEFFKETINSLLGQGSDALHGAIDVANNVATNPNTMVSANINYNVGQTASNISGDAAYAVSNVSHDAGNTISNVSGNLSSTANQALQTRGQINTNRTSVQNNRIDSRDNTVNNAASVLNNTGNNIASMANNGANNLASVINNTQNNITSRTNNRDNNKTSITNNRIDSRESVINNTITSGTSIVNNLIDSHETITNNRIDSRESVINNTIVAANNIITSGINTLPDILPTIMPLLTSSQEQLHNFEARVGERIDYLFRTSILRISREAIAARLELVGREGIKGLPKALIGDVSNEIQRGNILVTSDELRNNAINNAINENVNRFLTDEDLAIALMMDVDKDGTITLQEMRDFAQKDKKNQPLVQRLLGNLTNRDMALYQEAANAYNIYNYNQAQQRLQAQQSQLNVQPIQQSNPFAMNFNQSNQLTQPTDLSQLIQPSQPTQPSNLNQPTQPNLGGIPGSINQTPGLNTDNQNKFNIDGMSDDELKALIDELKEDGYELDFDNPETLDFNKDGVISDAEKDFAVQYKMDGMNFIQREIARLTGNIRRQAGNAQDDYNSNPAYENQPGLGTSDLPYPDAGLPPFPGLVPVDNNQVPGLENLVPVNTPIPSNQYPINSTPVQSNQPYQVQSGTLANSNITQFISAPSAETDPYKVINYIESMKSLYNLAIGIESGRIAMQSFEQKDLILKQIENAFNIYLYSMQLELKMNPGSNITQIDLSVSGKDINSVGTRNSAIQTLDTIKNVIYRSITSQSTMYPINNNINAVKNVQGNIYSAHGWKVISEFFDFGTINQKLQSILSQLQPYISNAQTQTIQPSQNLFQAQPQIPSESNQSNESSEETEENNNRGGILGIFGR